MNVGRFSPAIGGFDLGFERAGMWVDWQVERDAYCRAVLARHFPDARGDRAVLRVSASNLPAARCGWRAFLRRSHDRGEAYIARFVARDEGRRR